MRYIYLTNNDEVIRIADESGVDRVMIDLELLGKKDRQRGWDSVISEHRPEDVNRARAILKHAELMVRVNPINVNSAFEVEDVIRRGADIIMLPYFKTAEEVKTFLTLVNGRVHTSLLLETREAVENIDSILSVPGIDEIHIGLNDLSHSYWEPFIFNLFTDGTVDYIVGKFKEYGIEKYGIGGVARLDRGLVRAQEVIAEHYRLGSSCAILSRAFCSADRVPDLSSVREDFPRELARIRAFEKEVENFDAETAEVYHKRFYEEINAVSARIGG